MGKHSIQEILGPIFIGVQGALSDMDVFKEENYGILWPTFLDAMNARENIIVLYTFFARG